MNSTLPKPAVLSLQYYSFPDAMGGAWKLTHETNKRLVERGRRVVLITCKPDNSLPDHEVIDGVEFDRIPEVVSKNPVRLWRAIRKRVKHYLNDGGRWIAHMHSPLVGALALTGKSYRRIPKVYHFHSSWYDEEKINLTGAGHGGSGLFCRLNIIRWLEWACYRSSKSIIFFSEYTRRRFIDYYPFKKPRMRIIHGGVDTEKFCPPDNQGELIAIRQRLDLPLDHKILLTVRRLEARMGLDNLIEAVAEITKRSPDLKFTLLIAGKGSLEEKLKSQSTLAGMDDRIHFLGFVPVNLLPIHYAAADIFIMPTVLIEGFGLATVEALSAGLPVLGTPVGGTTEILKAIDPNLLFRHVTPQSMAEKIESYLKNPNPINALKSKCREEAVANYTWDLATDHIEEEFDLIWKNK
jgi:glycosyltransferase involved in cell wall biosynthesis